MPGAHDVQIASLRTALGRRRIVGVLGSGTNADRRAADLGRMIAALGCDLLTGGGAGVMAEVSRAFFESPDRRGLVIGIIPGDVPSMPNLEWRQTSPGLPVAYMVDPRYPNRWVELAIYTHLPDSGPRGTLASSRNHINVLSSNALVALPGGEGTLAEMWLAREYGVPLIAFGDHDRMPDGTRATVDLQTVRVFLVDVLRSRADK